MRTHICLVPLYKFSHPGDLVATIFPPLDLGIAKHYPSVSLPPAVIPQLTLSLLIILVLLFDILKVANFEIVFTMLLG